MGITVVRPALEWQDTVAVAGKEHGVDEPDFAPGELGHEGDDQLVLTQAVEQIPQAQIGLASPISFSCSHLRSSPRIPEATSPRHWV